MNKAISIALAGALAASTLAAATTGASAHYRHHRHHNHHYVGPGPLVAGAIFGLAIGAFANAARPAPYPAPVPYDYRPPLSYGQASYGYAPVAGPAHSPHSDWCVAQYASYNHADNTWRDFQGRVQVCISPY
ncbi:MAG: BA14K family protein [Alphaproteobacteria bacterium]